MTNLTGTDKMMNNVTRYQKILILKKAKDFVGLDTLQTMYNAH